MSAVEYNKTQLSPDTAFERHVYHRDMMAHFFRWSHVLKTLLKARGEARVLDVGCGTGNLLEVLYRNRAAPARYLGLDVRPQTVKKAQAKWAKVGWAEFAVHDSVLEPLPAGPWDFVVCFEVLEHVGHHNARRMLDNLCRACGDETVVFVSTPCYDERVGAADNHIVAGEVGEFTFEEMRAELVKRFDVETVWGTFASQRDIQPRLSAAELHVYERLKWYYDTSTLSVLFAPLHPEASRNCIWRLTRRAA